MAGKMKRVMAILQEPASYTVDRNRAVYDKMGIDYCYINSKSEAKSEIGTVKGLAELDGPALKARLKDILKNYDIIIFNGYTGRIFVKLYLLNHKYKRVIGIDSDTQLRVPANPLKRMVKHIWLSNIFHDKRYYGLAGGTGNHKKLFHHYGMPNNHICLMPMMVDNSRFFKYITPNSQPVFRFLYVGRIVDAKNIPLMLEAFTKKFSNDANIELRVIGDGVMLKSIKEKYRPIKNITFAGPLYGEKLTAEYHKASALILPSSYEPWGLVVNEAMAAGLPVIVSDQVGAAHDLVEGHDTGFIFPYQDADKLAQQMTTLVEDKELYARFSTNAANRMKTYWNYDLYTRCLQEFIEKASCQK